MKTFLRWALGIGLIVTGLTSMFAGVNGVIGAVLFIAAGLLCIPPALPTIERIVKRKIEPVLNIVLVVVFLLAGNWFNRDVLDKMNNNTETSTASTVISAQETTAEKVVTQEDRDSILRGLLQKELAEKIFAEGLDMKKYGESKQATYSGLEIFKAYAILIEKGKESANEENKKLAAELEKKLSALQKKSLPQLRKAFANFAKETLWEENIDVAISGSGNTILTFTAAVFANNKAIKACQENINEPLNAFRFKQSRYRWFKYDDEYTYYNIEPPADGEVVSN